MKKLWYHSGSIGGLHPKVSSVSEDNLPTDFYRKHPVGPFPTFAAARRDLEMFIQVEVSHAQIRLKNARSLRCPPKK